MNSPEYIVLKYSNLPFNTMCKKMALFSSSENFTIYWAQKIKGFVVSNHRNSKITSLSLILIILNNISS